jgi:hypothetical protein
MLKTAEFFASNPVFSLDDVVRELMPPGGRVGAAERLRHYLETGRLRSVSKGVPYSPIIARWSCLAVPTPSGMYVRFTQQDAGVHSVSITTK